MFIPSWKFGLKLWKSHGNPLVKMCKNPETYNSGRKKRCLTALASHAVHTVAFHKLHYFYLGAQLLCPEKQALWNACAPRRSCSCSCPCFRASTLKTVDLRVQIMRLVNGPFDCILTKVGVVATTPVLPLIRMWFVSFPYRIGGNFEERKKK